MINIIIGVLMIIGGLSGQFVLIGLDGRTGNFALAGLGVVLVIWGIVRIVMNRNSE